MYDVVQYFNSRITFSLCSGTYEYSITVSDRLALLGVIVMKMYLCDDVEFSLAECDIRELIEDMRIGEVRTINLGASGIVTIERIA